jgi:MSHA biogenesis protein MshG
MPSFAYVARDQTGSKCEGVLELPDLSLLADTLAAQGLMLVRAETRMAAVVSSTNLSAVGSLFTTRVSVVDLMLFCRQFATLLRAGVPLLRGLRALEESATNRRFQAVLADIHHALESGRELSAALRAHGDMFSTYMVNMVRVGEVTGRLPAVFDGLYSQLSFTRDSREQVRTALRYPSFVIVTILAALLAVNVFVIPAFAKVYQGLKAELPPLTQALVAVSNFIVSMWPVLLALTAIGVVASLAALRRPAVQRLRDAFLLRLPIIGPLVHKAALARFTRSFGLALDAGVPIVDALQVATDTTDNLALAEHIGTMRVSAERGEGLARAAAGTGVFTPIVLQMVAVGEETGALSDMMNEVASHYQREVDYAVKSLSSQIEPLLVILLGGFVLVFALGVFLPLWDLSRVALH